MDDKPGVKGKNEWFATRFEGVNQRESWGKRFRGRPEISFQIDYIDPITQKRTRQVVGKRSQGMTAEAASAIRIKRLAEGRERVNSGDTYVPPSKPLTLGQAWDLYLHDWLEAQGKSSARDDAYLFEKRLRSLASLPLSAITPHELDRLAGGLIADGLAPASVKYVLGLLRRVMRKMVKWRKWRGMMPFDDFEMPKVNNARTRVLTPYRAQAFLEALAIITPRMWQMSLISLHCGLRFGEVAALTKFDVSFDKMTLLIRDPKGKVDRHAIMTPTVAALLREVIADTSGMLLFPSRAGGVMNAPSTAFFRTVDALGMNESGEVDERGMPVEITDNRLRVVFHTWRHTYGSWLGEAGDGQETIADRLGHSSNEMSERYTHVFSPTRRRTALTIEHMFNHGTPPSREEIALKPGHRAEIPKPRR